MTVDEFKKAIQNNCTGKAYADFPKAFKAFIEGLFRTVDIDGIIGEKCIADPLQRNCCPVWQQNKQSFLRTARFNSTWVR